MCVFNPSRLVNSVIKSVEITERHIQLLAGVSKRVLEKVDTVLWQLHQKAVQNTPDLKARKTFKNNLFRFSSTKLIFFRHVLIF